MTPGAAAGQPCSGVAAGSTRVGDDAANGVLAGPRRPPRVRRREPVRREDRERGAEPDVAAVSPRRGAHRRRAAGDRAVPRLLWTYGDGDWVLLAFEDIAGTHPAEPWRDAEFAHVLAAMAELAALPRLPELEGAPRSTAPDQPPQPSEEPAPPPLLAADPTPDGVLPFVVGHTKKATRSRHGLQRDGDLAGELDTGDSTSAGRPVR